METEAQRAAFHQAHKDDPEIWGELERPPARRGPKKRLTATITVRFTADESALIRRQAEQTGSNYSEVVRRAVRALAKPIVADIGSMVPSGPPTTMGGKPAFAFKNVSSTETTSTGQMRLSVA